MNKKILLGIFAVLTLVGLIFLGSGIGLAFSHFFRAGLWMLLGPLAGFALWNKVFKKAEEQGDGTGLNTGLFIGAVLFWAGLFGPLVAIKADRSSSIPDVSVLYQNGKVINATDSTKKNFYFKQFSVSPEDSLYIVKYGEEPGFNKHALVQTGDVDSSNAPRASEDWKKPESKAALKLKGKY